MRNAATTEVRAAKKYFEQRIAKESKDNPKAFWKYVKSKTVCKTNVGNLKYNGKMAETEMEKAEMLKGNMNNQMLVSTFYMVYVCTNICT